MSNADAWRSRLRATGRSDTDLARKLHKSKSTISRIMTGDRKDLRKTEIDAIEAALAEFEGVPQRAPGLIPLLGYTVAGGQDKVAWSFERALDWVEAPPMRDNTAQVVAVRISGDSMEPRLFSGETVYVGVGLSPARGGDAVIEFTDGTAIVKSYAGSRHGYIFAHQYNPDEQLKFEITKVRGLHAVLWRR